MTLALERPLAAATAALAVSALLLALYLVRRRAEARAVPSLRLWRAVQRERATAPGLARLARAASLLLQLVATLALAVALGGPRCEAPARQRAPRVVFVLDASASMAAREPGPAGATRLELAREALAREALEGPASSPATELALLEAGCAPRVALAPTRSREAFARALAAVTPRDCGGDLSAAIALGATYARAGGGAPVLRVYTDAVTRAEALPAASTAGLAVRVVGAPGPLENVGITAVELRATSEDPATQRRSFVLFVAVERSAAAPSPAAEGALELRATWLLPDGAGEALAGVRAAQVNAGRTGLTLPLALAPEHARADLVRVTLRRSDGAHDALALDDEGYAPVPRPARLPVQLVTAGPDASPYLARALAADPAVALTVVPRERWRHDPFFAGLTVLHGGVPEAPLDGVGAALAFGPFAPTQTRALGFALGPERAAPRFVDAHPDDLRVRYASLGDVHPARARPVALGPAALALATAQGDDGALLAATPATAPSDATLVAFDPHESDWPLRASFVLFLRGVTEHARARGSALAERARRSGAPVSLPAPDATALTVTPPAGPAETLAVRDGAATLARTERRGVYTVARASRGSRAERFALSLFDPLETRLEPRPLRYAGATVAPATRSEALHPARAPRDLAPYALALALLALLVEALHHAGALRRARTSPR